MVRKRISCRAKLYFFLLSLEVFVVVHKNFLLDILIILYFFSMNWARLSLCGPPFMGESRRQSSQGGMGHCEPFF